jgi:hypothetical protein
VKNLYPGRQSVSVQYHCRPRAHGSNWGFQTQAKLAGQEKFAFLDHVNGELIAGLGGPDISSLYQMSLGEIGTGEKPRDAVELTLQRWIWSKQSRIRAIRIVTEPSLTATQTLQPTPLNNAIRRRLGELAPRDQAGRPSWGAAVIPSTVKVKPKSFRFGGLTPEAMRDSAELSACRNERESFQILLFNCQGPLEDVTWSVSPVTGPDGEPTEEIGVLAAPVGYVQQLLDPYTVDTYGYMPDAILPFMDKLSVATGDARTLWVRLAVSSEAAPGVYRGAVTVTPSGKPPFVAPFTLRVWDVELPNFSYLPVVICTGATLPGGPEAQFAPEMDYRINPSNIYGWNDEYFGLLEKWAEMGVRAVNLHYIWKKMIDPETKMPTEEQLQTWCDEIGERYAACKAAGLGDAAYVYMFDEGKPEWYPALRAVSDAIRARFPDLTILTTAQVTDFGVETDMEAIDAWCPNAWGRYRDPNLADRVHALGDQAWWYTCNSPRPPQANVHIDNLGMETRMLLGLRSWAYRVDGFLYYMTRSSFKYYDPIESGPYSDWVLRGKRSYGDGQLYQKTTGSKPLPSIRMECIRDGLEDYDLLAIASACCDALEAAGKDVNPRMRQRIRDLRRVPNDYVGVDLRDYCRDADALAKLRQDLGEYVEAAQAALGREVQPQ